MAITYTFPTNFELQEIGPAKVARLSAARLGLQIMPTRNIDAAIVRWEQRDNYRGLQQLRGLNGAPASVRRYGSTTYSYEPGVYGEFIPLDETELTLRAVNAGGGQPVNVGDLVVAAQDQLLQRRLDRIESIIWTLLTTGTFSITGANGSVFSDTFAIQTYTGIDWADPANGRPLYDFQQVQQLGVGLGVNFGAGARAVMNRVTANRMLQNSNTADLAGKLIVNGNTIISVPDINRVLGGQDMPSCEVYDEGYYDDNNAFQKFLPNGTVVVIGQRPDGQRIGEYVYTRNLVNPDGAAGPYTFVKDMTGNGPDGQRMVPPKIEVHDGHNGGPVIYFPGSIVVMSVTGAS